MIVAISQPTLYPWIGYFDIINKSDAFVFLNDVQLNRRSWQTRNRIRNPNSEKDPEVWLNIPVIKSGLQTLIKDARIDNSKEWKRKHIGSLNACYGQNFRNMNWLHDLYSKKWELLAEFNIKFIKRCCDFLCIKTPFYLSSELCLEGTRTNNLVNICKHLHADVYLTTAGAKENYLDHDQYIFDDANIEVKYHNYVHPEYKQHGLSFIPYLSVLDLILNLGDDAKKFFTL